MGDLNLRPATEQDLVMLSAWFLTESEARTWAGPFIHFPLELNQLKNDIDWATAQSFAWVDEHDHLLGFAQVRHRFGYNHLARIVISPEVRGRKLSYKLMDALFTVNEPNDLDFSLFVYTDNIAAVNLYKSIGFHAQICPEGQAEFRDCIFMVKEIKQVK